MHSSWRSCADTAAGWRERKRLRIMERMVVFIMDQSLLALEG